MAGRWAETRPTPSRVQYIRDSRGPRGNPRIASPPDCTTPRLKPRASNVDITPSESPTRKYRLLNFFTTATAVTVTPTCCGGNDSSRENPICKSGASWSVWEYFSSKEFCLACSSPNVSNPGRILKAATLTLPSSPTDTRSAERSSDPARSRTSAWCEWGSSASRWPDVVRICKTSPCASTQASATSPAHLPITAGNVNNAAV
mmetsp:Transcript_137866/g.310861  ORF Transcript_137866/g.310861 Transcript_137866/m.310861 type:complete len:203 (-) Transcript_137866:313-921(-)